MDVNLNVRQIQEALAKVGQDPGPIDGVWGRRTLAAVMAFQRSQGLEADGIVGPRTVAALRQAAGLDTAVAQPLPWMEEATRLIHTREMLGPRDNPDILHWADRLDIAYPGDDVPWCGLFVGHCIGATLPTEVMPAELLRAKSWAGFGDAVTPRLGAVMVFWRTSPESGLGHVGFYAGESASAYYILGGNQSDSVCYIWMSKGRLVKGGARWPKTARLLQPVAAAVPMKESGPVSVNEA